MTNKRYLIASILTFAFIFVFEWIFHGMGLKGIYQETAQLWRPEADMGMYMKWLTFGQVLFALVFTLIYTKGYEGKGIGGGIRYGLYVSLLFVASNFVWYAVMPIPMKLIIAWDVGTAIELAAAGALVSLIYKPLRPSN